MSRLRPITTSDPSSEEARLVGLIRPPPPMSAAQVARCSERVTELARAPRVASKPWMPLAAVGAAVVVAIAGGVLVADRTNDAGVVSGPAQVQTPPQSAAENRAPDTSEVVPAVSIDSLPSADPPIARGTKRTTAGITPTVTPSPSASSETTGREDMLTRELRLVDGARVELARHPSRAYDLLTRHAAEFPSGQLASEREVLLVDALIRLDRRAEAEARGRSLVTREPGSPYAQRVEALLASAAVTNPSRK